MNKEQCIIEILKELNLYQQENMFNKVSLHTMGNISLILEQYGESEVKKLNKSNVSGSLPSATQIATDFIQEMMCDEIEPKAKGNIHPITEDVLKEWFIQIGVRNGNDR